MHGPETFVARAADDPMAPGIAPGDFVWVDPDEPAVVRLLVVAEGGRRLLRALGEGYPEIVVDADNETGIRGVAVLRGRRP